MKKALIKTAMAAGLAAGALAFSAGSASAYIVCNSEGDCWHVRDHYTYPTGYGIMVHDDDWTWDTAPPPDTAGVHVVYRWREHTGRGYWRNGVWVEF